MLVTVTPNTAIDQTFFISELVKGMTIRANRTVQSMAGKPTDAAFILGKIGMPSIALGFAAGTIGERVKSMLHERHVETRFIPVDGESRINTIIIDESIQQQTVITASSLIIREEHIQALCEEYTEALKQATCVIMGGSLPKDVSPQLYADFIREARSQDIPVIFDGEGDILTTGLSASPTYIKPNEHELAMFTGETVETLDQAYAAGQSILEQYGTSSIITLGERGALAVLPDKTYHIEPIKLDVVSPAGAGDGVLAGLARSIVNRQSIESGLKAGIAFASAVCLQPGTAEYDVDDFDHFLSQVKIVSYTSP